jgi:hypothetical protein
MVLSEIGNTILNDVVAESFERCRECAPPRFQIHYDTAIYWNYPVVWKVFIAYFTHFRLLTIKNPWTEWQQRKND